MIQAVVFDAVGTLLRIRGSVGQVYAEAAQTAGLHLPAEVLEQRFRAAFRQRLADDVQRGHRTDAVWERGRWQAIVAAVFYELPDAQAFFQALWERFARPAVWEVFPDVVPVLHQLRQSGLILAVGSNFDSRLHDVLDGLPELRDLQPRFVSAEVGWSKPAREFFAHVLAELKLPGSAVLMVGDHWENDVVAARAAGLRAMHIARGTSAGPDSALASLTDLPGALLCF